VSSIVLGVGASHSTLMNTNWDDVVHPDRAERFRNALGTARAAITEAAPDVAVIVGSNHFRGFWLDLIPAFTLGVGEAVASGEAGTPEGPQPVDVTLARSVCDQLVDAQFDVAFSARLQMDHGQTHAIQYLLAGLDLPIVPLVVNVFAPPLPSLPRCEALGAALAQAIEGDGESKRVVVIASGGLSHRLPFPDWKDPHDDDQAYLVEAWMNGRTSWKDYEVRRRSIVRAAPPDINAGFDRSFLADLAAGKAARLLELSTAQLGEVAGNGAQELRTWLIMAAACRHAPGRTLAYEELPEWLTGMAVALVEPPASSPPAQADIRTTARVSA